MTRYLSSTVIVLGKINDNDKVLFGSVKIDTQGGTTEAFAYSLSFDNMAYLASCRCLQDRIAGCRFSHIPCMNIRFLSLPAVCLVQLCLDIITLSDSVIYMWRSEIGWNCTGRCTWSIWKSLESVNLSLCMEPCNQHSVDTAYRNIPSI